jgi:ABC-type transport system substrate-binding protein
MCAERRRSCCLGSEPADGLRDGLLGSRSVRPRPCPRKRLARGRRGTAIFLICANAGRRETGAVIKAELKPIGINVEVKAVRNYYEDANTKG